MTNFIKGLAASLGYRITRLATTIEAQERIEEVFCCLIAREMSRSPDFTFLQVGGYDGRSGDPVYPLIRHYGWRGVICEPAPESYQLLERTYSGFPKIRLERVAVSRNEGTAPLYFVRRGARELPDWVYQHSSFNPEHVRGIQVNGQPVDDLVEKVLVPCSTVHALVAKHQFNGLDLLQIDTEGHDLEILRSLDFCQLKPKIIRFEHRCMSREQKAESARMLLMEGYQIVFERYDTLAFLNEEWEAVSSTAPVTSTPKNLG